MTEARKDGKTESGDAQPLSYRLILSAPMDDSPRLLGALDRMVGTGDALVVCQQRQDTPDILTIMMEEGPLHFGTTFAPGPKVGMIRCFVNRGLFVGQASVGTGVTDFTLEEWRNIAAALTARNTALGLTVPDGEPKAGNVLKPILAGTFSVASGFVPMHRLAERHRGGLPLFPEARRQFHEMRTPLSWAVGLALFSRTSEKVPDGWQEVTISDLADRVFCLTERDAPRRGDHRTDILAEVVKLHAVKNAYVRYDWERRGRAWRRVVALGSNYAIPNLELVFLDKKGRRVLPSDPSLRSEVVPLEIKGRRAYTPDGKDIKALPKGRFTLDRIRWRWNPSFADDLKATPALDAKGQIKRDASGKVLRGGFNIRVAARIFDALFRLRAERAFVAHDLLVLLAHDIYKPPKQSTAAGRNVVEREADRLFDLLGLEDDPKHPDRREEAVAGAVYRLKQVDIAALLPGSDERPRPPSDAELTSGRRKAPFYRLVRSPDYTPAAALVTKDEAAALEAEAVEDTTPAQPPALPGLKTDPEAVLPGIIEDATPIPSGSVIRAARVAAGLPLRAFARLMGGPSFKTWSNYETGKPIRVGSITPDTWQRVRDFIAQHGKKGSDLV